MRPPAFWSRPASDPGWQAKTLSPLGALYAATTRRRMAQQPGYRATVPVICVGNINAGGTGKTPTVAALAGRLAEIGQHPHVVSRGYGGSKIGPLRVDPLVHRADEVGDEPLLLAAFAPVWVARDRAAGVRAAEAGGATVILLDDGFQNPSVRKDYAIVVVDAGAGFGNGRVIPAGPLREPVVEGLARADRVLCIGDPATRQGFLTRWRDRIPVPVTTAALAPLATGMSWSGQRLFAFAGIGRPEKFFATLRDLGADVLGTRALDDHQDLSHALLARLDREAASLAAQLVTTEKDAVRLPPDWRIRVLTLPVRLEVDDDAGLAGDLRSLF